MADGGAEYVKRFKAPSKELLNTEVALLTGGADCHQRASIVFSKCQQDILRDIPVQDALDLVQYLVNIVPSYNKQYGISLLCDLKKVSIEVINRVADILNKIQFPTSVVFYAVQPKSKDLLKKLQYAIGLKSKKKHFKKCPYDVVLVSKLGELTKHFDEGQLTSEFGGTLTYSHAVWVEYRMVIERLYSKIEYSLMRVPATRDKLDMLQDYEVPAKLDNACHLLGTLSDKYHETIKELNLEGLVDEANVLISEMRSPDKSKYFVQAANSGSLRDDLAQLQKLKKLLVSARDSLRSLWQKAEHKLAKGTESSQHQKRGKKIIKWIHRVGVPTLSRPFVCGHDLVSAMSFKKEFEKSFYAQSQGVIDQANSIVAELDHMVLDGSPGDLQPLLSFARSLQSSANSFEEQLKGHHKLYSDMVQFFQSLALVTHWYKSTISVLPVHLLKRSLTKDGLVCETTPPWWQAITYHCQKLPPPGGAELNHMKQMITHVPGRGVRNKTRLIVHRVKLLLRVFNSRSKFLTGQALQIFQWHENVLEGKDEVDLGFSDSMSDLSSLNLSASNPSLGNGDTGSSSAVQTKSSTERSVMRSLSRTPKLRSRYSLSSASPSVSEAGSGRVQRHASVSHAVVDENTPAMQSLPIEGKEDTGPSLMESLPIEGKEDTGPSLMEVLDDTSPMQLPVCPSSSPTSQNALASGKSSVREDLGDRELYVDLGVVEEANRSEQYKRLAALLNAQKEEHVPNQIVGDSDGNSLSVDSPGRKGLNERHPQLKNDVTSSDATLQSSSNPELGEHGKKTAVLSQPFCDEKSTVSVLEIGRDAPPSKSGRSRERESGGLSIMAKQIRHKQNHGQKHVEEADHLMLEERTPFQPTPDMLDEITACNLSPEEQLNMMASLFNENPGLGESTSCVAIPSERKSRSSSAAVTLNGKNEIHANSANQGEMVMKRSTAPEVGRKRERHRKHIDSNLTSEQLREVEKMKKEQEREEQMQLRYYNDELSRRKGFSGREGLALQEDSTSSGEGLALQEDSTSSADMSLPHDAAGREEETSYFSEDVSLRSYLGVDMDGDGSGLGQDSFSQENQFGYDMEGDSYGIDIHKWISDGDKEVKSLVLDAGHDSDVACGAEKDIEREEEGQSSRDMEKSIKPSSGCSSDVGQVAEVRENEVCSIVSPKLTREGSCSDLRSEKTIDSGITDMTLDKRLKNRNKAKKVVKPVSDNAFANAISERGEVDMTGKLATLDIKGVESQKKRCKTPQELKKYFAKIGSAKSANNSFKSESNKKVSGQNSRNASFSSGRHG